MAPNAEKHPAQSVYNETTVPLTKSNQISRCETTKDVIIQIADKNIQDLEKSLLASDKLEEMGSHKKRKRPQVLAAVSVSLGSLLTGMSIGYTSPAIISMTNEQHHGFQLKSRQVSFIGGIMPLAALIGAIIGGLLIENMGRKKTIALTSLPFLTSWLCIGFAQNLIMVLIGRAMSGLAVGVVSMALPVYLAETLEPEIRGSLGLMPTAFGNIGILLVFATGKYLTWYQLAWLGAVLSIPFMIMTLLIPETATWYIMRDDVEQARKTLKWLGRTNVTTELNSLQQHGESKANISCWKIVLHRKYSKAILISVGLMFFQQMSGINAVIFYTVSIFKCASLVNIDENWCAVIVSVFNLMATLLASYYVDRVGRKVLLYSSSAVMIITLFTLGTYYYIKPTIAHLPNTTGIPLVCLVMFVIGFSFGFGPVPWLMMGEILPAKIRGSAASLVTTLNWSFTFLVTTSFTDLTNLIRTHGVFWMFGSFTVVGLLFVIFCVQETNGRSLEDIEHRMSSDTNDT